VAWYTAFFQNHVSCFVLFSPYGWGQDEVVLKFRMGLFIVDKIPLVYQQQKVS
jgi:hypothetical protein